MTPHSLVEEALASVIASFGAKAADITSDRVKQWIHSARSRGGVSGLRSELADVDSLAEEIVGSKVAKVSQAQYNAESLARWLEIPEPDLPSVSLENFDPTVLIQHVVLEQKFAQWFADWGYSVEPGEILRPAEQPELECITDVYGRLQTIHGTFEVAVNFVCDNPPDENRVIALASKMGAYAESRTSFSANDVFMIVTPWDFTKTAAAAILFQNKKREYCVLGVDGSVLHDLDAAESKEARLEELQEKVASANRQAQSKTID